MTPFNVFRRKKPGQDGALPSGNAVAARNLLRLAELTADERHRERDAEEGGQRGAAEQHAGPAAEEAQCELEFEIHGEECTAAALPPGCRMQVSGPTQSRLGAGDLGLGHRPN